MAVETQSPGQTPGNKSSHLTRRPFLPATYFFVMALATVVIAVVAPYVRPLVLGTSLAAYLLFLGLVLYRRYRVAGKSYPGWRNVMPCYLSVQDRDLRIIEANDLFVQDFGSCVGQFCYTVYKRRDAPCPNCPVLKTFEDGRNHGSEETVITRNGETARVVVTSAPLHDDLGRIVGAVEMSTNITEIDTLRQELERSKKRLRQLFDSVPCYISIHDRSFKIVESNDLFRRDFGEKQGAFCYQAYKNADDICADCPVEKTFNDGAVHSGEETVVTQGGRQINIIVYSMPLADENGEIKEVMEVSTDITEVKRLQRRLAMVGLAVSGMAHRIKNILMGLEGGIFVVNTGFEMSDKAMVDEGWGMVQRNVVKVSSIAQDLLRASKERQPQMEEGISPEAIVREVAGLYHHRAASEGIALVPVISETCPPGTFDPRGLHSLLSNLVTNAIDACRFDPDIERKKHRIEIRCALDAEGNCILEVADNGPGVPKEAGDKIFESFFSTKGRDGTGLGLLVVQQVLEEHGGSISYTTRQGEGTTFTVRLPYNNLHPVPQ